LEKTALIQLIKVGYQLKDSQLVNSIRILRDLIRYLQLQLLLQQRLLSLLSVHRCQLLQLLNHKELHRTSGITSEAPLIEIHRTLGVI